MGIRELFSQRTKRQAKKGEDLVVYEIPQELRVQISYILNDSLGIPGTRTRLTGDVEDIFTEHWHAVSHTVARNRGLAAIASGRNAYEQVLNAVLHGENDMVLDIVEVAFSRLEKTKSHWDGMRGGFADRITPSKAIQELNDRFAQWSVGYRFEKEQIVRVDSEYMHEETTRPVLVLLKKEGLEGPEHDFRTAHKHFLKGEYRQTVTFANAAFESLLKALCKKRGWKYEETDTAKNLLSICFANGLIPDYLQTHFGGLRSTLESGLPAVRNREGPHGAGAEIKVVPEHVAAYALHLTATNMIYLMESEQAL